MKQLVPVRSLSFTKNEEKIAEVTFSIGEAFLLKEEKKSEVLIISSEYKSNQVQFLCTSVDYDTEETQVPFYALRGKDSYAITLIAFNANKFELRLCINDMPMYSAEFRKTYTTF